MFGTFCSVKRKARPCVLTQTPTKGGARFVFTWERGCFCGFCFSIPSFSDGLGFAQGRDSASSSHSRQRAESRVRVLARPWVGNPRRPRWRPSPALVSAAVFRRHPATHPREPSSKACRKAGLFVVRPLGAGTCFRGPLSAAHQPEASLLWRKERLSGSSRWWKERGGQRWFRRFWFSITTGSRGWSASTSVSWVRSFVTSFQGACAPFPFLGPYGARGHRPQTSGSGNMSDPRLSLPRTASPGRTLPVSGLGSHAPLHRLFPPSSWTPTFLCHSGTLLPESRGTLNGDGGVPPWQLERSLINLVGR